MLKQTVQYQDFDGANKTKNLYFNITIDDVIENADIEEELTDLQREFFDGTERELTLPEKARIVQVVKRFMKIAYGVQTKDPETGDLLFDKSPLVWTRFTQTAAYDAFLLSLFDNEGNLEKFLQGVFPADVRQAVAERRAQENGQEVLPIDSYVKGQNVTPVAPEGDPRPAWQRELREPTEEELRNMSQAEMQLAYRMKASGQLDQPAQD